MVSVGVVADVPVDKSRCSIVVLVQYTVAAVWGSVDDVEAGGPARGLHLVGAELGRVAV